MVPVSPFQISFPTKNPPPARFIEELQKAVEAIQALQQELEMRKLVNSHAEFFFTEKLKDLEFELSELSDNFGDIRSYWISLKQGKISHHWISNSEIFINWGHFHLLSNWWTRNFEMNIHSQRWRQISVCIQNLWDYSVRKNKCRLTFLLWWKGESLKNGIFIVIVFWWIEAVICSTCMLQFCWSLTLTWENELVTWWKQLGNQNRTTWIKLPSSSSHFFNCTSLALILQRFWLVQIFWNFELFLFLFVPVHTPLFCWYTLKGGGGGVTFL